ncbi:unnamed protein product, partial [Coffea canephora]
MNSKMRFLAIPFLFFSFLLSSAKSVTYNVQSYGAKSDGRSDSTNSFLSAWTAACASVAPATIYVPPGRFLVGGASFWGQNCKNNAITIRINGTLVAPSDYNVLGHSGNWLKFERVNGLSIYDGTLDGQGTGLWACKNSGKHCPQGATTSHFLFLYRKPKIITLRFTNSNNIAIAGLTFLNSQLFHLVFNRCNTVKLQGVKVSAAGNSPNTDGIHVQYSSGVAILNSKISTGDDCVSIGPGTTSLWIENVLCGPGHGI